MRHLKHVLLVLPGILIIVAGRKQPMTSPPEIVRMHDAVVNWFYPDSFVKLVLCAMVICVPGSLFVVGADYLGEVTFARLPVSETPAALSLR